MVGLRGICRSAGLALALGMAFGAAAPWGQAQPAVTTDALLGIWQFQPPPCGSENGMGLDADGTAWITEAYSGTWRLEGATLHFTMDEHDMGVVVARNVRLAAELLTVQPDYLELRWDNGHIGHAWRCR